MKDVLLVASTTKLEKCASTLEKQLGLQVELAGGRQEALETLKRRSFAVVVVEESLVEGDLLWADQLWAHLGFAVPLQVNFAILGCSRLAREVKAALFRREGDRATARLAVASEIQAELKSSLTGLLLQTELALSEPSVPPALEPKLRQMVELAGAIREQLRLRAGGVGVA